MGDVVLCHAARQCAEVHLLLCRFHHSGDILRKFVIFLVCRFTVRQYVFRVFLCRIGEIGFPSGIVIVVLVSQRLFCIRQVRRIRTGAAVDIAVVDLPCVERHFCRIDRIMFCLFHRNHLGHRFFPHKPCDSAGNYGDSCRTAYHGGNNFSLAVFFLFFLCRFSALFSPLLCQKFLLFGRFLFICHNIPRILLHDCHAGNVLVFLGKH